MISEEIKKCVLGYLETAEQLAIENIEYQSAFKKIKELVKSGYYTCSEENCNFLIKSGACNPNVGCNSHILREIIKIIEDFERKNK